MIVPALLISGLAFAMAILASRVVAVVQGKDPGVRLESNTAAKPQWFGVRSMLGYHPLSPRLWFEIVRARDLPWDAENKQRLMRILFGVLIVALLGLGGLSIYFWSSH
jgi:hypothetical protein